MKVLINLGSGLRSIVQRRPDVQVWGDARALPFTEGQAVVARGAIAPASTSHDST